MFAVHPVLTLAVHAACPATMMEILKAFYGMPREEEEKEEGQLNSRGLWLLRVLSSESPASWRLDLHERYSLLGDVARGVSCVHKREHAVADAPCCIHDYFNVHRVDPVIDHNVSPSHTKTTTVRAQGSALGTPNSHDGALDVIMVCPAIAVAIET